MRQKFHFDFVGNSKKFFIFTLSVMLICLILNIFVFPTELDIQFTGGAIMKYSYSGDDLSESEISKVVQDATEEDVTFQYSQNMSAAATEENANTLSIELTEAKTIDPDTEKTVTEALQKAFPDNNFTRTEITSVDPTKGTTFFWKCMAAVAIAAVLMIIYVGIRFRKIGGISAGCTAVIALIHDIILAYFAFVLFRMPLDDNFIAVILTIIGYSVNDTIVIFDRIRENRRYMGPKATTAELVNQSLNQTLGRSICTAFTTLLAIASVLVVALVYDIQTVVSFALPMMVGVVVGCYSSILISAPLWVMWTNFKKKRDAEKKAAANQKPKSKSKKTAKADKAKKAAKAAKAEKVKKTEKFEETKESEETEETEESED